MALRIKRTSGRVTNLYIVSSIPPEVLEREIVEPSIPNNFLTLEKIGDKVKRIRLYDNVSDALSSIYLGQNIKDSEFYVYRALGVRNESLIEPGILEIPYLLTLDSREWWYLSKLRFNYITKIKVDKKKLTKYFNYGRKSLKAPIYFWEFSEVLKKWEKPKLKIK